VVFTNQSTSNLHWSESKYPKPFGGDIISSMSSYIIGLECINYFPSNIVATLIKSPVRGFDTRHLKLVDFGSLDECNTHLAVDDDQHPLCGMLK
jgi:hypothetical protein